MAKSKFAGSHLVLPFVILGILLLINLFKGVDFFNISISPSGALYGNIPNILFGASELVILAIGMTLVTSSSGGQDISVGVAGAITSAVFVQIILAAAAGGGEITGFTVLGAFLGSAVVGVLIGAFNGTLVAIFKVQPMVATLILFTAGRSVAFLIDGKLSPIMATEVTSQLGSVIPGVPIQTPIILTVIFVLLFYLFMKTTNLKLYSETVGINQGAARLNGIDPIRIKFLTYMILGICTAVAGFIAVTKAGRHDSVNILKFIEMDAILAVAIGGNALSGGKFSIGGSILGAYTIELLTRTLLRLEVETEAIKAFKAVFIIILMVVASPVVREYFQKTIKFIQDRSGRGKRQGPAPVAETGGGGPVIPPADASPRKEA